MSLEIHRRAHAKVNPFLRVIGRRPDGFHEVETLVHPIDLADDLTVRQVPNGFVLRVEGELAASVPAGPENLVVRAAAAMRAACGAGSGAEIVLVKRIPVAAGLGGGSADAAAVIDALGELWGCADVAGRVAASIGSDVPALLAETPVLARGRGELVEPAEVAPCRWRVIPAGFGITAAQAYGWWDEDGGHTGPDPAPLLAALAAGDLEAAGPRLFNDLEEPILRRHPELQEAKARLLAEGAFGAVISGSGPSVAGLYPVV
ncbi:MAG: 4-(cytidine 5'-diphospho)-2-C-methyl-D-erythritol kinase [Actinomycetota bacterium]